MVRRICLAAILAIALSPTLSFAEKPDMPRAKLEELATHVVVARVNNVYTKETRDGAATRTHYVAELTVTASEKGKGLESGDLVYVRYWRLSWSGDGIPLVGSSGHRRIPKEGDSVRVYLARNASDGFGAENEDGGYNVIGPNGFEPLEEK